VVNLGMLGFSQAMMTVAAFATQTILARALPQDQFGMFMTVMALVALVAPVAVYGVSELWLQQFGREGVQAYRWVDTTLRLVWICSGAVLALLLLWSIAGSDAVEVRVRMLLALIVVAQSTIALAASALQLRGSYQAVAGFQLIPHAGRVLVVLVVWIGGLTVTIAAFGYALVAVATIAASMVVLRPFAAGKMPLEGHAPAAYGDDDAGEVSMRRVVADATPFTLGNVFYLLGMNLGTVVAGEFLSSKAAAVLAVPMAILMAVYLIPRVVYQQYFLAKLHRWSQSDDEAILMAYRAGTVGMIAFGALIAVVLAAGGWLVIPMLFGSQYAESVPILAVLSLAIPLRFGAASVASLLTSGGLLRRKVIYQGVGALVYVAALAIATPLFGLTGAAVAIVTAESVLLGLFWRAVRTLLVAGRPLPEWSAIFRRMRGEG
jgi:O-antigen/teichoic acid export membrane protein